VRSFVEGKPVFNAHPVIRMFSLCSAMQWNHLPVAGGMMDQNPQVLEMFEYMFTEQQKAEERKQKKKDAEMKRNSSKRPSRGRRR
jgi:hypothetical protein